MKTWKYLIGILLLISTSIWLSALTIYDNKLHIVACDVGQGDAILIYQKNKQVLIDGGPDNKVMSCLGKHLPFWDRDIELVILTHPQLDHYGGLAEVFENYNIDLFLANAVDSSNQSYQMLKNVVGSKQVRVVNPYKGQHLRLDMIYIDILSPNLFKEETKSKQDILGSYTTKEDLNDYSIVAKITYDQFDSLFTGDIGPKKSNEVAEILNKDYNIDFEYIKIPHHGSKNGLSPSLLEEIDPEVAVISVGLKNRYGHPNKEIMDMLSIKGVKTLRTDLEGDVEVATDGKTWYLR